jgi:hypothetical protein
MNNQDLPLIPPWDLNNVLSRDQSMPNSISILKSQNHTVSYIKDLHEEWYQGRGVYGGNATQSLADN